MYTDNTKKEQIGFNYIKGCFIKQKGCIIIQSVMYYNFSIVFSNKTQTYLTLNIKDSVKWSSHLRSIIGYRNFFDYYVLIDDLGIGAFGDVKLGLNKSTNEKVAVKIIHKKKSPEMLPERVQNEIDIMKFNRHPSLVKFIDSFENSEYYFIVMEFAMHGNLSTFQNKNFS